MGIRIMVKTEGGEIVCRGAIYSPPSVAWDPVKFPLLSGIDPYGDTVFNRMQAARLVAEAGQLGHNVAPGGEPTGLEDIETVYATYVRSPPHRYLWFVGD
jgi:hypothetical protein